MQWGIERTDRLGLESFIEATPEGQALYETCGYRPIKKVQVNMVKYAGEKGTEWEKLEREKLPIGYTATWRPAHGVWKPEEPERTWRERFKLLKV
jgi:hypothetical protein